MHACIQVGDSPINIFNHTLNSMAPNKFTVLAADSEPLSRQGMVAAINNHPQLRVCAEAASLGEVRDLCLAHQPDVLVLDPAQGDGFALIKDLPRWSPRVKTVVLTRLEDASSVQRAFQAGACGYVTRRDPAAELINAVLAALEGERLLGSRAQRILLGQIARGAVQMDQDELARLSQREIDVFRRIGSGQGTREIAEDLGMSVKTVETHRQRIKEKLGLTSGAELLRRAVLSQQPDV